MHFEQPVDGQYLVKDEQSAFGLLPSEAGCLNMPGSGGHGNLPRK